MTKGRGGRPLATLGTDREPTRTRVERVTSLSCFPGLKAFSHRPVFQAVVTGLLHKR